MIEQRRTKRFEMELPVEIIRTGSDQVSETGTTRNISSGGVLFMAAKELEVGGPVEYVVTLTSGNTGAVNLRCMGKVLDQTSAVARSMGSSDHAIRMTREYLATTSKMQIEMIDQITDGWKQQLKSGTAPMAIPQSFTGQVPGLSATTFGGAMPEFSPLAPWTFWLQAAEMWQRTWMPEGSPRKNTRSH